MTLKSSIIDQFSIQTTVIISIDISFKNYSMHCRRNRLSNFWIFDIQGYHESCIIIHNRWSNYTANKPQGNLTGTCTEVREIDEHLTCLMTNMLINTNELEIVNLFHIKTMWDRINKYLRIKKYCPPHVVQLTRQQNNARR